MPQTHLEVDVYDVHEASNYLRVPISTLQWWLEGGTRDGRKYLPVIRESATGSNILTWGEFVEAWYVRQYRREHRVDLSDLRDFIKRLRSELELNYPLAHARPYVGPGRQLVKQVQDELGIPQDLWVVVAGHRDQLVLSPTMTEFMDKVDFADTESRPVVSIHPRGHHSAVVIDPERASGSPSVRGIRTEALAELVEAGENIEEVARDFNLPVEEMREALSYEWDARPQRHDASWPTSRHRFASTSMPTRSDSPGS